MKSLLFVLGALVVSFGSISQNAHADANRKSRPEYLVVAHRAANVSTVKFFAEQIVQRIDHLYYNGLESDASRGGSLCYAIGQIVALTGVTWFSPVTFPEGSKISKHLASQIRDLNAYAEPFQGFCTGVKITTENSGPIAIQDEDTLRKRAQVLAIKADQVHAALLAHLKTIRKYTSTANSR